MLKSYQDLRRLSAEIAAEVGVPRFYRDQKGPVAESRSAFEENAAVRLLLEIADGEHFAGHGRIHIRKVAVDAGAVILIEAEDLPSDHLPAVRLMFLAHLAGVLHDIKRSDPDHARLGAAEAGRILELRNDILALLPEERKMIEQAIANHEAFQPAAVLERRDAQLLSDTLYDADKFRWGPENFTDTLWDMLELRGEENLPALFQRFTRGLEGIEKIKETFRTRTGRVYGPDFIDRGLTIGRRLYAAYCAEQP